MCKTVVLSTLSVVLVAFAAQAQTVTSAVGDAVLPPPLSITQQYVPVKGPRAPLALLVDDSVGDSSGIAAASDVVTPQPMVAEEVGDRPAIAALAHGRLAITVSDTGESMARGRAQPNAQANLQQGERHE